MELVTKENTMNEAQSFDWTLALKQTGQKEVVAKEILGLFLIELPKLQKAVNEAYQNNQLGVLADELHKIHGSCSYCGVPKLKKMTLEFEKAVKKGKHSLFQGHIDTLNQEITDIQKAVSKAGLLDT